MGETLLHVVTINLKKKEESKKQILVILATEFNKDQEFMKDVNRLTFGFFKNR